MVEDDVSALKKITKQLRQQVESLTAKMENLENRRSNVRLISLPDNAEGRDVCAFLEKWIPEVLGVESFPAFIFIEKAHRVPTGFISKVLVALNLKMCGSCLCIQTDDSEEKGACFLTQIAAIRH